METVDWIQIVENLGHQAKKCAICQQWGTWEVKAKEYHDIGTQSGRLVLCGLRRRANARGETNYNKGKLINQARRGKGLNFSVCTRLLVSKPFVQNLCINNLPIFFLIHS